MPEVLIELGEQGAAPALVRPPPQDAHPPRLPWLLAVILVPVLILGGGARAGQPFRDVASIPAGSQVFAVTASAVDAVDSSTIDTSTIVSYPVAGGPQRWRVTVPGPVTDLEPHARSGVLLAVNPPSGSTQPEAVLSEVETVSAVDEASGRLLWSVRGARLAGLRAESSLAVLLLRGAAAGTAVAAVDLRTGRERWRAPFSSRSVVGDRPPDDRGPPRLAVLDGDTLTLLDEQTGALLATRPAQVPSLQARAEIRPARLYLIGGLAIVAYEDHLRTVYAAFDLPGDRLAPRWRTTMPAETDFLADCGAVLCAGTGLLRTCYPVPCSAISSYLFGLDAGTAALRWTSVRWSRTDGVRRAGTTVIALNRDMSGNFTARGGVIDPLTGRTVLDLGRWYPVTAAAGTGTVFVARRSDSYHSSLALLRPPGSAGAGGLLPLGDLPVAAEACQSTPAYLVCPTLDRRLTIWRYRVP